MPKTLSLSDQVRRAIDASDKSRYRIAKDLGISEATLSRFMSSERRLTLTVLDRLASTDAWSCRTAKSEAKGR